MAESNLAGGTPAPQRSSGQGVDTLGPSDTSDSGSDVAGERQMATGTDNPGEWGSLPVDTGGDSDAFGTGERSAATGRSPVDGADLLPDRIIGGDSDEAPPELESLGTEGDEAEDGDTADED